MKTFTKKDLPSELADLIQDLTFDDELTGGCIGIVNLKDGFAFYDGSHIQAFRTKKDLIELLKKDVNKE